MRKTSKSKIRLAIIATLACTAIVTVQYLVLKPSVINQIQINRVYIGGLFTEYPTKYQPRCYIEFKEKNKYVFVYDDSRGTYEDYNEDGDWRKPHIDIYFGRYDEKEGLYKLTPIKSASVGFKNPTDARKGLIDAYGYSNLENNKEIIGQVAAKNKKGNYVIGNPSKDGVTISNNGLYFEIYDKSDIKKLPSSVEEFRKQFKMDKKAEQERLAEQKRLAEQSQ